MSEINDRDSIEHTPNRNAQVNIQTYDETGTLSNTKNSVV